MDFKGKLNTLLAFGERSTKTGAISQAGNPLFYLCFALNNFRICEGQKGSGPRKFQRRGAYV